MRLEHADRGLVRRAPSRRPQPARAAANTRVGYREHHHPGKRRSALAAECHRPRAGDLDPGEGRSGPLEGIRYARVMAGKISDDGGNESSTRELLADEITALGENAAPGWSVSARLAEKSRARSARSPLACRPVDVQVFPGQVSMGDQMTVEQAETPRGRAGSSLASRTRSGRWGPVFLEDAVQVVRRRASSRRSARSVSAFRAVEEMGARARAALSDQSAEEDPGHAGSRVGLRRAVEVTWAPASWQ